ncbi:MAG: universal stress protein [Cyanobacteria bacterium P01_A01_bin.114]
MFNKILIALDTQTACAALFNKALTLAQATDADLMLLSVLTPEYDSSLTMPPYSGLSYYSMGVDDSAREVYQARYRDYEAKGLEILHSFTDQATATGISTEFTQVPGNPGRAICNLAKTWQADLVIVGSHGRKGLTEALLGSVSNYVMHHAPCSVLVVHAQAVADPSAASPDLSAAKG